MELPISKLQNHLPKCTPISAPRCLRLLPTTPEKEITFPPYLRPKLNPMPPASQLARSLRRRPLSRRTATSPADANGATPNKGGAGCSAAAAKRAGSRWRTWWDETCYARTWCSLGPCGPVDRGADSPVAATALVYMAAEEMRCPPFEQENGSRATSFEQGKEHLRRQRVFYKELGPNSSVGARTERLRWTSYGGRCFVLRTPSLTSRTAVGSGGVARDKKPV